MSASSPEDPPVRLAPGTVDDSSEILGLIRALAEYERLSDEVSATEQSLRETLFGAHPAAEVVIARAGRHAVGFALYFQTYSTFLAKPGLYLEDLFVVPEWRGRGIGKLLLGHVAALAVERGCGRFEWAVLDWNEGALELYRSIGAKPMDGWTVYRLTGAALRRAAQPSNG